MASKSLDKHVRRQKARGRTARALAEYLVADQAVKSIKLELGNPHAKQWAALRSATPLMGYPTVADAEKELTAFLFG